MHKSKFSGFIDCRTDDLAAAAGFWSAALGMPVRELPREEGRFYKRLQDAQHGLHIEVQKVQHPSRVHLDIETDDVEAEVRRLEKLGARGVEAVSTWWVMEAPTDNGSAWCGRGRPISIAARARGPERTGSGLTCRRQRAGRADATPCL